MSANDGTSFAAIEPVHHDPRGEISAEIAEAVAQLRRDLLGDIAELRDEVRSLQRVLDSRTEHLA